MTAVGGSGAGDEPSLAGGRAPLQLLVIVLVIMLIAFLAGTLPAARAAKKDPIEALRYE